MSTLIFNGNEEINSVFSLIGNKENDISKSVIWILKECPKVLKELIETTCGIDINPDDVSIQYQSFERVNEENAFTDIEITDYKQFHIIIEAKRGWILPGYHQLKKYSEKTSFANSDIAIKKIFSLSECSEEYADKYLPFKISPNGIPIGHISWKVLKELCESAIKDSNNKQKNLIREFLVYLGGIMGTPNNNSNEVFVVPLNYKKACSKGNTYIDVVVKENKYFCPVSWFRNVNSIPNYLGFRYDGKLQRICHIDSYVVTRNRKDEIPFMDEEEADEDYYVFRLGVPIYPPKEVVTGQVYGPGHNWADIDLLLTCDSVKEACDKSKERRGNT